MKFNSAKAMDPRFDEFDYTLNGFSPSDEQSLNFINGINHDSLDLDVLDIPLLPLSPNNDSFNQFGEESPDDQDSDPVLKFLNQILIEENMEEKPSMFHDPLALRATEKSLYDALGQKYPIQDSPDSFFGSSSECTNSSSIDNQWIIDPGEYNSSFDPSFNSNVNLFEHANLQNIFTDSESILQFNRGMEEASKFLPTSNPLVIDLDQYELPQKSSVETIKVENKENDHFPNGLKGRKHHYSEDNDSENLQRSSKQSATYEEEDENISLMFDRVLLFCDGKGDQENNPNSDPILQIEANGRKSRSKKTVGQRETVDLRTLLISCAQSVASDDRRTAHEQLKQIRQHSSETGDLYQRLANVFAYGLEARLAGTGTELYYSLARKKITASEKLKAYQVYLSACPFKKMSILFANKMIAQISSEAKSLHIIDFGILYGFQWPVLIQHLSQRPNGPPNLRITGVEVPLPGFKPSERVQETGARLTKYCKRFGVPFSYHFIATQNWEKIKVEDFNIVKGEILAVNCFSRFENLLDETVMIDSPRDSVLNLIRKLKPNIFVHAVNNGNYSTPFFVTRFKEALFHYSALFDVLDSTLPRESLQRLNFERDFFGREVINVIACEGAERVERPESYKQWQVRHIRAGFEPIKLDFEIMEKLRNKVKSGYHKDFLFDEGGKWMLQGWKGRILYASSCWVPV